MSSLDTERLVLSGGPIGLMQAALTSPCPSCASMQTVQCADRHLRADAGQGRRHVHRAAERHRAYAYLVAQNYDAGRQSRIDPASCHCMPRRAPCKSPWEAIQALGGNGYINEFPAGRLLRDAKLYEIGAGTNEIRRMLIGRELFHGKS